MKGDLKANQQYAVLVNASLIFQQIYLPYFGHQQTIGVNPNGGNFDGKKKFLEFLIKDM